MNIVNKAIQLVNSIDVMIDSLNIFNFSFVIDADFDALGIGESLGASD